MSLALIALLLALTLVTSVVLADSGLRMWSAFGALKAERMTAEMPRLPAQRPARISTRVSFARTGLPVPKRAAA